MPQKSRMAMTPQPPKSKRLLNQKKTPKSVPPPKRKAFIHKSDEVPSNKKAMRAKLFTKTQKAGSESDEFDSDEIEEQMPVSKAGQKRKGGAEQRAMSKTPIQGKKSPGLRNITPAKHGGKKQKIEVDSDEDDDDDDDDDSESEENDMEDDENVIGDKEDDDDDDNDEEEDEEEDDDNDEEEDEDDDEDEDVEKEIQSALSKQMKKSSQKTHKQKVTTQKTVTPKAKPTPVSKPATVSSDLTTAQKEEDKRREIRDRKTLFVKHLPSSCTVEELEKLSSDIVDVRLSVSKKGCRGFGFLEFADEKTAEKNFKILEKSKINKRQLVVDFVGQKSKTGKSKQSKTPEGDLDPLKLYVTGFAKTAKASSLEKLFPTAKSIDFPTKKKTGLPCGYAFIKYDNAAEAKHAHSQSKNLKLDGKSLVVLYAKISKPKRASKGKGDKPQNNKAAKAVNTVGGEADESDSDDGEDLDYEGEEDDEDEDEDDSEDDSEDEDDDGDDDDDDDD